VLERWIALDNLISSCAVSLDSVYRAVRRSMRCCAIIDITIGFVSLAVLRSVPLPLSILLVSYSIDLSLAIDSRISLPLAILLVSWNCYITATILRRRVSYLTIFTLRVSGDTE
jgi:hypothetical protein